MWELPELLFLYQLILCEFILREPGTLQVRSLAASAVASNSAAVTAELQRQSIFCHFCWALPPKASHQPLLNCKGNPRHLRMQEQDQCQNPKQLGVWCCLKGRVIQWKQCSKLFQPLQWETVNKEKLSLEQLVILSFLRPECAHHVFLLRSLVSSPLPTAFSSPAVRPQGLQTPAKPHKAPKMLTSVSLFYILV